MCARTEGSGVERPWQQQGRECLVRFGAMVAALYRGKCRARPPHRLASERQARRSHFVKVHRSHSEKRAQKSCVAAYAMVREGALSSNLVVLNGPCSRLKKSQSGSGHCLVVFALGR